MKYEEILKELSDKRRDIQFSPKSLDNLSEVERRDIEGKLVELIKSGVSTSYKYIPYIKYINLQDTFPFDKIPKLPLNDILDINKHLYLATKNSLYLDTIIVHSLDNLNAFSLLLNLYNDKNLDDKNELLNILLSVIKYTKNEKYFKMFNERCENLDRNINLNEIYNKINPMHWIPNSLNSEIPIEIIDENGKILSQAEAVKKVNNDYNNYLNKQNYYETILSGILGFAIGDAMGVPVEFTKRSEREKDPVNHMQGFGSHNVPEGTWSDDTSMTVATIDSIIENDCIDYEDMMNKFLQWRWGAKYTATDKVFDVGITTNNALNNYRNFKMPAIECGSKSIRENGNGSLMRVLPICYFINTMNINSDEKTKIINEISSMTHAHEISRLGCKIYSDFVERLLLNGCKKEDAYNYIKTIDYSKDYSKETVNLYKRILEDDISKLDSNLIKSGGYIVDTLEAALWSTLTSSSYEESIVKAINLGNDTDTVGAITGSLTGMIYKYKSFPKAWTDKLKKRDYLIDLSMKFVQLLENNKKKVNSEIEEMNKIK